MRWISFCPFTVSTAIWTVGRYRVLGGGFWSIIPIRPCERSDVKMAGRLCHGICRCKASRRASSTAPLLNSMSILMVFDLNVLLALDTHGNTHRRMNDDMAGKRGVRICLPHCPNRRMDCRASNACPISPHKPSSSQTHLNHTNSMSNAVSKPAKSAFECWPDCERVICSLRPCQVRIRR